MPSQENRFLSLVQQAHAESWCTRIGCTTCGNMMFRDKLQELTEHDKRLLTQELLDIDLDALAKYSNWTDCVVFALQLETTSEQLDRVLLNWLGQLRQHVRLADKVLFYCCRNGLLTPISPEMCSKWISSCIVVAVETRDCSLLESLVYVLRENIAEHKDLKDTMEEEALRSEKLRRALSACGLQQT